MTLQDIVECSLQLYLTKPKILTCLSHFPYWCDQSLKKKKVKNLIEPQS